MNVQVHSCVQQTDVTKLPRGVHSFSFIETRPTAGRVLCVMYGVQFPAMSPVRSEESLSVYTSPQSAVASVRFRPLPSVALTSAVRMRIIYHRPISKLLALVTCVYNYTIVCYNTQQHQKCNRKFDSHSSDTVKPETVIVISL